MNYNYLYEPVDTVIGIYVDAKEIKNFFKGNKNPKVIELLNNLNIE